MFSIVKMTGKLYAMKSVDSFDDFQTDPDEVERSDTFVRQGEPIIFCEELEDLEQLFGEPQEVEIIE